MQHENRSMQRTGAASAPHEEDGKNGSRSEDDFRAGGELTAENSNGTKGSQQQQQQREHARAHGSSTCTRVVQAQTEGGVLEARVFC